MRVLSVLIFAILAALASAEVLRVSYFNSQTGFATKKVVGNVTTVTGASITFVQEAVAWVNALGGTQYTLTFQEPLDGSYGAIDQATGRMTGMIGDLAYGRADIAAGDININEARTALVDFTGAYSSTPWALLVKASPQQSLDVWFWLEPFTPGLWLTISACVFFFAAVLYVLEAWSPFSAANMPHNRSEHILYAQFSRAANALLNSSAKRDLTAWSVSLASWGMTMLFLVIVVFYYAFITSFMARQTRNPSITSLAQLRASGAPFCATSGTNTETYFRNPNANAQTRMLASQMVVAPTSEECVAKVRSGAVVAYFDVSTYLTQFQNAQPCDLMVTAVGPLNGYYAVPVRRGHPILQNLTAAVLHLVLNEEAAALVALGSNDGACDGALGIRSFRLDVRDLAGLFITAIVIAGVALVLLGIEVAVFRARDAMCPCRFNRHLYRACGGRNKPASAPSKRNLQLAELHRDTRGALGAPLSADGSVAAVSVSEAEVSVTDKVA